jgi:cation:H+ antiporter
LVEGASSLARRMRISELAIGLTVVAFGTSLPELFVNIISSAQGNAAIALGNVLGSNIANILLILGISSVVCPLVVSKGTAWKEIPFCLLAVLLVGAMANDRWLDQAELSVLSRIDGIVFLSFFLIFLIYTASIAQTLPGIVDHIPRREFSLMKSTTWIFIGLVGLSVGGKWIVDGAVHFAAQVGISQSIIGLTIVAIGTSLPELATSVVAARKKNIDIAVGNIVGSNIFNVFFILGVSAVIKSLPLQTGLNFDIAVATLAAALLFFFMFTGKKHVLDRWEGILFILLYIGYISYSIVRL